MKTTLVILAGGLSSRYGASKQTEGFGANGEVLADYAVYDAIKAGFNKIVYVIKEESKDDFEQKVAAKIRPHAQVELVFQKMEDLPAGFAVPKGRERPWGTCHALWAARHAVNEPFVVISADDFYGAGVFKSLHDFLTSDVKNIQDLTFAMPGHKLKNTVSDHGSVSRAVCDIANGFVTEMREIRAIEKRPDQTFGHETPEGFEKLCPDTTVNMLAFAFTPAIFGEIEHGFNQFFGRFPDDLTAEYYLNSVVRNLIVDGKATMRALPVADEDKWMGVTYPADREIVQGAIQNLTNQGKYPVNLF
ncbi:MAG: sugar phosphate nucleotidyltransferase [Defluviitaleaceae bacterium]|nr:sugar phosphate nucleotidyltransferase [Defluviitaleaceae bacterium]